MRIGVDIDGVLTNRDQFQMDYGAKYCFDNNIKNGYVKIKLFMINWYFLQKKNWHGVLIIR